VLDGVTSGEIGLERLLLGFPQAVVALDRDRRVVFANDEARSLFGADALQDGAPLADPFGEGDLDAIVDALAAEPAGTADARLATRDDRTLRVTGASHEDAILLVVEDVTAQHREERAVQEFVRNAAHQLRTPLTGIATAVEVLQSGAKSVEADRDRFLGHVSRHTARLLRIVRGLLALARAQSGEALRLGPVAIAPMLGRLAGEIEPAEGVAIVTECAPQLRALAEPNLLEETLAALLENAIAHTAAGEIRIRAQRSGEHVTIAVVDTGAGIAATPLSRVFEPFYRGTSDGEGDRFGLGLAIAAQAVRAMSGRIDAVDTPVGAHLAITLLAAPERG
jgi:signal transduction histidine kinase